MFGPAAAYVVAATAMLISGSSALLLIRTVNHFDPPETRADERPEEKKAA